VWVIDYECFKLILEEVIWFIYLNYRNGKEDFTRKETIKVQKNNFFKMEVFEITYIVFLQQIIGAIILFDLFPQ
jgi:hypothetical protein